MSRIRGLATISLHEPHPAGFDALKHEPTIANLGPDPTLGGVRLPHPPHFLGCMCSECEQHSINMRPGMIYAVADTAPYEKIIDRLRSALKVCGFTTEEIDSIAADVPDGVRVIMEGHIVP